MPFACAVLAACALETSIQSAPATITGDALQVVGTITAGKSPDAMAITPNGNYVYVDNYGSGTVSVINALLNKVSTTIPIPSSSGPTGIVITSDGSTAFVLADRIFVISTATNQILKTIPSAPSSRTGVPSFWNGLGVTPDGTQLYVSNFNGTVSIINVATGQIENTLKVGYNAFAVAISPDGKSAYVKAVADEGPFYLTKIDVASQTIELPQFGAGLYNYGISALVVSPDSQTVYVAEAENSVLALNADTGNQEFRVRLSSQPQLGGLQVSPSGKSLYVVENSANAVATINTPRGTQVGTLVTVGNGPDSVVISGRWLYVLNTNPGTRRNRGSVSIIHITH